MAPVPAQSPEREPTLKIHDSEAAPADVQARQRLRDVTKREYEDSIRKIHDLRTREAYTTSKKGREVLNTKITKAYEHLNRSRIINRLAPSELKELKEQIAALERTEPQNSTYASRRALLANELGNLDKKVEISEVAARDQAAEKAIGTIFNTSYTGVVAGLGGQLTGAAFGNPFYGIAGGVLAATGVPKIAEKYIGKGGATVLKAGVLGGLLYANPTSAPFVLLGTAGTLAIGGAVKGVKYLYDKATGKR